MLVSKPFSRLSHKDKRLNMFVIIGKKRWKAILTRLDACERDVWNAQRQADENRTRIAHLSEQIKVQRSEDVKQRKAVKTIMSKMK